MFWRRKKDNEKSDDLELPPLEDLRDWVSTLIVKLDLQPGKFTILPAFGGILLYVQNEGIMWIPYKEIQESLGDVDKSKLAESSALIGGAAAVATGTIALPTLLIPRLLKGSYNVIAKPSPKKSMTFLHSIIDEIVVEKKKLREGLLNTFEELPYLEERDTEMITYIVSIYRKFLDKKSEESTPMKIIKGIMTFVKGASEAVFAIPGQAETEKFVEILQNNGINVIWMEEENS